MLERFAIILQQNPDSDIKSEVAKICGNFTETNDLAARAVAILELLQKDQNSYVKCRVAESCGNFIGSIDLSNRALAILESLQKDQNPFVKCLSLIHI